MDFLRPTEVNLRVFTYLLSVILSQRKYHKILIPGPHRLQEKNLIFSLLGSGVQSTFDYETSKVKFDTVETFIHPLIKLLAKSKCLTKNSCLVSHAFLVAVQKV